MASFVMEWEAPEYEYREKGVSWYWLSIIVAAIIVAFSVWEKNFLFGLFIIVAEMLFIVWGNRLPRTAHFQLTETDLTIDREKSHPLKSFESMSIDTPANELAEVIFIFRAKLKTPIKVFLPENRIADLRNNLKTILKEIPYEPTFLDAIEKLLRF